ncbi:MAG: cytochrome c-type biogenesis protein CcmH [Actinobacteria bacterium]|nr:cytochrome c-type biogenesis protein CcmH [Actinomycetota bacterium]
MRLSRLLNNDVAPLKRSRGRLVLVAATVSLPLLVAVFLASAPVSAQAAPPVSSVSDKIICQCGCNAVLSQCPHEECGWGVPAKQFIAQELDKGRTPAQLMQYYVSQYGEKILAAPTKRGFNLAAWLTPFVALIVGGVAVYFLVTTWTSKRHLAREPEPGSIEESPDEMRPELIRQMEDELREFD